MPKQLLSEEQLSPVATIINNNLFSQPKFQCLHSALVSDSSCLGHQMFTRNILFLVDILWFEVYLGVLVDNRLKYNNSIFVKNHDDK